MEIDIPSILKNVIAPIPQTYIALMLDINMFPTLGFIIALMFTQRKKKHGYKFLSFIFSNKQILNIIK